METRSPRAAQTSHWCPTG